MSDRESKTLYDNILKSLANTLFVGLLIDENFRQTFSLSFPKIVYSSPSEYGLPETPATAVTTIRNFEHMAGRPAELWRIAELLETISVDPCLNSFCTFFPDPWLDDITSIGVHSYNIPYHLFLMLDNKTQQFSMFRQLGDRELAENIANRISVFGTRFLQPDKTAYRALRRELGEFVVAGRTSSGGGSVFLVNSFADFAHAVDSSVGPIVRVERFYRSISFTQLGIVFANDTIYYPPQPQFIRLRNGRLQYSGVTNDEDQTVKNKVQRKMSRLTQCCGRVLATKGYRGAFGCDFIYVPEVDDVFLMELNPRFVGETHYFSMCAYQSDDFSSRIEDRLMLDPHFLHVAAFHTSDHNDLRLNVTNECGKINISPFSAMPYDTIIPFSPTSAAVPSFASRRGFDNTPERLCLLLKDFRPSSLEVLTEFPSPVEEAWRDFHVEGSR